MKYSSGSVPPSRWGVLTDRAQRTAILCVKKVSQHLSRECKAPLAVVFVAGVQRSGTNMMMDILGRSMQTEVFHESHSRGFQDFELKSLSTLEASVRGRLRGRPS
jgi:protein tyrosine phosphatase